MQRIGTYDVLGHLGRGGMGVVLRARCAASGREVALKVLDPALLTADGLSRFEREVAALTRLRHPHVVGVLGAGPSPHGPWVAMELVEGESLQARLDRAGPLAPADVVAVGRALCSALTHAHGMGVVHRDVKPGNVILGRDGRVVLVDFGLARLTGRQTRLTVTGEMVGTPCFMAPEQAQGEDHVGPLADVYSVGATLYAALTGRPPIVGDGLIQVLDRLLTEVPDAPSALRPAVPAALSALVMRCLDKAPDRRPASAEALDAALARVHAAGRAPPPRTPAPPVLAARRSSRGRIAAAVVVLAASAGGAAAVRERARAADALARAEAAAEELDIDALVMRGRAQLRLGDATGALATGERAIALAPDDPRAWSVRGGAARLLGDHDEVRSAAERLARLPVSHAGVLHDGAVLALSVDALDLALVLATRSLELAPHRIVGVLLRWQALTRLGRLAEAADTARAALLVHPDHPELLLVLVTSLGRVDGEEALALAAAAAARHPGDGALQRAYADLLERVRRDLVGAEAVWTRFLDASPDDEEPVLRARARLRLARRDWDGAASDLERLATLAPDDPTVWERLAEAHRRRRALTELEAALDRLVALRPTDAGAWRQRGEVRQVLGRSQEALADLTRAVEVDPGAAQLWCDRGTLRLIMGDAEGAVVDLERAAALDAGDPVTWANLARAHGGVGQHARSLEAAQRAIELRPDSPHAHAYLASALLRLGRVREGVEAGERALSLERDPARREALRLELERIRERVGAPRSSD